MRSKLAPEKSGARVLCCSDLRAVRRCFELRIGDNPLLADRCSSMARTTPDELRDQSHILDKIAMSFRILAEGRDFRSPNKALDGPDKSMWGQKQREWLKSTLKASDAKWKLVISLTPMVGPDDAYQKDNHASLQGFRHEADAFFDWTEQSKIDNRFLMCGDRHWQYHSIHPSGINGFAVGALNDESARMGVPPGADFGTDPEGLLRQPFTSPKSSGGFLQVIAGETLQLMHFDDQANELYSTSFPLLE